MLSPLLREIHRLRKLIRDAQAEIDRAPKVLKAAQAKLAATEKSVADAKEELKKRKAGVLTAEATIKSLNQTLSKYNKQSEGLTSPRDIEAKSHEIANTKELIAKQEEEYLNLMTEVDERTAKIPDLDASLVKAKADFARFQTEAAERLAQMKSEVATATAQLAEQDAKLPAVIRPQYDRLVKAHGADALAAAENQSCKHCRVGITAQMYSDLQKEAEFICCRNCGRGLYLL
jgi:predicted  nucleic acid-binding Zn-ribbon protein